MIRDWVPARAWPLADALGALTRRSRFQEVDSWEEAVLRTTGYEALVSDRPVEADEWNTGWPSATQREVQLLAAVGMVLPRLGRAGILRVLDFGGGSGQYGVAVREAYPGIDLEWTVVETAAVHHRFATATTPNWLRWDTELSHVGEQDIVLASGSLNYVADPLPTLKRLAEIAPFLVITRFPLWPIAAHRPAVQYLNRGTRAGYPTWFFSESRFRTDLAEVGETMLEWSVPEDTAYFAQHRCDYHGLLLASSVVRRP